MTIRWTVTNRSTGQVETIENPIGREHVKDGVRRAIPPKQDLVDGMKLRLKHVSKLGMRGGVLA